MPALDYVVHSRPSKNSSDLLSLPRKVAGWEWMSFFVRRLKPGQAYALHAQAEQTAIVLLSGKCFADWGEGKQAIGERESVFDGWPYAIYLPAGSHLQLIAETVSEFAECRVRSTACLEPRMIRPEDVKVSLRGGRNASRQIVDVMPSAFEADKLMLVEVNTPSGNWSSFPPHKHDVHNPPAEVDLDEVYYYRINRAGGYAHQRLYTRDGNRDVTGTVRDGDAVLVRDGFHPIVAGHEYDVYYLNCLAGSARLLSNSEDPDHAWVHSTWTAIDPRLPLVRPGASRDKKPAVAE